MHLKSIRLLADRYPTDEAYPFKLPVLRETSEIPFTQPVTFFVGENGTGKSTVLEALARRCNIHIWREMDGARVIRNKYEQTLHYYLNLEWHNGVVPGSFFASQIFQHFSRALDEWAASDPGLLDYFGGQSLMTQSHGQSLMSFFKSRFALKGLYLLDEPETALSAQTQVDLLQLLARISQAGHAQFIVATHSPILLACPGATIYSFDAVPVRQLAYKDTEHYRIYKQFLNHPEEFLGPA